MHNVEQTEEQVYEAPRVESVLTTEELEREVLYAGAFLPSGTNVTPVIT